jgi:RNA polymerase sigma factor (sigma-70 family)
MDVATASEPELLTASIDGDRSAFAALVDRCATMVYAVAFAATRDRLLSEDVSQDTFVAAWQDLARLRDPASLRPWLCQIARNLALKARRDSGREVPTEEIDIVCPTATALDSLRAAEIERLVADCVTRVPEPYRETIVLFYYEERSAKAVAAALGVSEEVVFKRLSRGRQHVASELQPLFERELTVRRGRRRMSACVLALLPRKGFAMSKIGAFGFTAAAIAGLVIALPRLDAAPRKAAPVSKPNGRVNVSTHRTTPPRLAAAASTTLTCTAAAHHLVELGLAIPEFRSIADDHPDKVALETSRLEQECHDEAWSETDINCVLHTGEYEKPEQCVPGSDKTRIKPVAAITDIRCDAVGPHVAEMMVAEIVGPSTDSVSAAIIADPDEILRGSTAACRDQDWSEPLRQCYAAATRMSGVVRCNIEQSER